MKFNDPCNTILPLVIELKREKERINIFIFVIEFISCHLIKFEKISIYKKREEKEKVSLSHSV